VCVRVYTCVACVLVCVCARARVHVYVCVCAGLYTFLDSHRIVRRLGMCGGRGGGTPKCPFHPLGKFRTCVEITIDSEYSGMCQIHFYIYLYVISIFTLMICD